jgi:hypothetical protein
MHMLRPLCLCLILISLHLQFVHVILVEQDRQSLYIKEYGEHREGQLTNSCNLHGTDKNLSNRCRCP